MEVPQPWRRCARRHLSAENHNLTHEPEDRPTFTSRYWDLPSKPLYPFGCGLSYSTFRFANLRLSKDRTKAGEISEVQMDVTNTGTVAGSRCSPSKPGRLSSRQVKMN